MEKEKQFVSVSLSNTQTDNHLAHTNKYFGHVGGRQQPRRFIRNDRRTNITETKETRRMITK